MIAYTNGPYKYVIGLLYDSIYQSFNTMDSIIPSEARLYSRSIDIFRRRRQPEVGLKTSISQEWCTGSLSDWQA